MPIVPLPKTMSFAEEYEPVYDILDVASVTVQDDLGFWGVPSDIFGLAMENLSYTADFDDARDIDILGTDILAEAPASATAAQVDLSTAREACTVALLSPLQGCSPLRSLDISWGEEGLTGTRASPEAKSAAPLHRWDQISRITRLFGRETTKNRRATACRAEPFFTSTPTIKTFNTYKNREPSSWEPLFPSHPRTPPSVTFIPSRMCDATAVTPSMTEDELDETDDESDELCLFTPPSSTRATPLPAAEAAPVELGLALDLGPSAAATAPLSPVERPLAPLPLAGLRIPFEDTPAAITPRADGKRPWLARKVAFREGGPSWRQTRERPQNTTAETCQH